ncbi:ras-domain-containing protein [Serendipita vermifera]|nr:ras-domain-containing protein [Serendipita vermifera]
MLNVKLVIIGASGVGKTSLRTKYTSGRFSTNYRATIGADFITKTIPHYSDPEQSLQLQIWDTAGQERFSSLATAFFRGADAVILVYDVTDPSSLHSLTKWWDEFRSRAPVEEGKEAEFPVAVVGNKVDLIEGRETGTWKRKHRRTSSNGSMTTEDIVTQEQARAFLSNLIASPDEDLDSTRPNLWMNGDITSNDSHRANGRPSSDSTKPSSQSSIRPVIQTSSSSNPSPIPSYRPRNQSIQDGDNSRATSRSRYAYGNGTVTTTAMSIYHTASSSLIDSGPPTPSRQGRDNILNGRVFWDPEVEQAIAANSEGVVGEGEIILDSGYKAISPAGTPNVNGTSTSEGETANSNKKLLDIPSGPGGRQRHASSSSDGSVQTITQGKVGSTPTTPTVNRNDFSKISSIQGSDRSTVDGGTAKQKISKPPVGPGLFFASAKTGEGLSQVFEWIGERVTRTWEWEESRLNMLDSGGAPGTRGNGDSRIILRELRDNDTSKDTSRGKNKWGCC